MNEVRAALGLDVGFGRHGAPCLEGSELLGAQKHLGVVQSDGPQHVRLQRLAGFRFVGDYGAQGEDAEVAFFQFALLVCVDQIAASALQPFRHAVRQHVLDAVQYADLRGLWRGELGVTHKPVPLARSPLVLERQPEVVVHLFKYNLVAEGVFVQVPLAAVAALVLV